MADEKLLSKTNIIILVIMVLVISLLIGGFLFIFTKSKESKPSKNPAIVSNFEEDSQTKIFALDPFIISIMEADEQDESHYLKAHLKIKVNLEINNNEKIVKLLQDNKYIIMNNINEEFSKYHMNAFYDYIPSKQNKKMMKLKNKIIYIINQHFQEKIATNIYLSEYFIQPV